MSNIPLMSDGRNFSTWEQPINMDLYLQNNANINNNWSYRKYLTDNAHAIIKLNQQSCIEKSTFPIQNQFLPETYFNSDLKNVYLSREELQNKTIAPTLFKK